jgi:hypothetical protein
VDVADENDRHVPLSPRPVALDATLAASTQAHRGLPIQPKALATSFLTRILGGLGSLEGAALAAFMAIGGYTGEVRRSGPVDAIRDLALADEYL